MPRSVNIEVKLNHNHERCLREKSAVALPLPQKHLNGY
jgi:hypothetical protein